MQSVGLNKVTLVGNNIEKPQGTFIDFNAIAKGYGVDVIGEFLKANRLKIIWLKLVAKLGHAEQTKKSKPPGK